MSTRPSSYKMVDPSVKMYYYYKLSASEYVLYDENMGSPIMDRVAKGYGSFALVGGIVSRLSTNVMIYYFERDSVQGFKLKKVYHPDKEKIDVMERKDITKTAEKKKK